MQNVEAKSTEGDHASCAASGQGSATTLIPAFSPLSEKETLFSSSAETKTNNQAEPYSAGTGSA